MNKPIQGWVYILTNPSFREGMIKIGFTNKPTPQERALELSRHTGVPTPFTVVYAVKVPNAQAIENRVHQILQAQRAQDNREFFDCSVTDAVKTIKSVAGKHIIQEMDNRKSAKKPQTPPNDKKNTFAPKQSSKHKNHGGIITRVISALVMFGIVMMVIGWLVEQKEDKKANKTNNKTLVSQNQSATATTVAPNTNPVRNGEIATTETKISEETPPVAAPTVAQNEPIPTDETQHAPIVNAVNPQDNDHNLQAEWQQSNQALQAAWDKIPNQIRVDLLSDQEQWLHKKTNACLQADSPMTCETQFNNERITYLRGFSID